MPEAHDGSDRNADSVFPDRPEPMTVFVLGILSLVGCSVFAGIPAWILGNRALHAASTYTEAELMFCKAGRVLGSISTGIALIGLVIYMTFECNKPSRRYYRYDSPTFGAQRPANLDP